MINSPKQTLKKILDVLFKPSEEGVVAPWIYLIVMIGPLPLIALHPLTLIPVMVTIVACILFVHARAQKRARFINRIIKSSHMMTHITNFQKKTTVYINHDLMNSLGYASQATYGFFPDLCHAEDRPMMAAAVTSLKGQEDGAVMICEMRAKRTDGTWAPLRSRISIFSRTDNGEVKELLVTTENLSHERRLEEELDEQRMKSFHQEKMASLGEMAGGIAHEINNPLAIILGLSQTMRVKTGRGTITPEDTVRGLEKIETTIRRITKILNSLRMIARDGLGDQFVDTNLELLVDDMKAFWSQRLENQNIGFAIESIPSELQIHCRPVQIVLVLLNLISNAFHAVRDLESKWIQIEFHERSEFVEIWVTDSGPGIPEENRQRIFEPFFTTKTVGEGPGLGLSIAKGIVAVHSGHLSVDPSCANTRFVLAIPKSKAKIAALAS